MDITIEVMLPERAGGDFSAEENNGFPILSVVAVYPELKIVDVNGMPRTGYIHVVNVPDNKFDRIKAVLEQVYEVSIGVEGPVFNKMRRWAGVSSRMSAALRNRLLNNRQIGESLSISWTTVMGLLRNLEDQRDLSDADLA